MVVNVLEISSCSHHLTEQSSCLLHPERGQTSSAVTVWKENKHFWEIKQHDTENVASLWKEHRDYINDQKYPIITNNNL